MSDSGLHKPRVYRLTRYSIVWVIAILTLVPYEIWAIVTGKDGGALSHVVWWAYGEPQSWRWWLVGCAVSGFLAWAIVHFLFRWPGLTELAALVALGLVVGTVGALATH